MITYLRDYKSFTIRSDGDEKRPCQILTPWKEIIPAKTVRAAKMIISRTLMKGD